MSSLKDGTYYSRYRAAAIRFEVIGGVLLAVGILLNLLFSASLSTASLLIAAAGAFLLVIGGSSLRPHNLVKAFAQQCTREPCDESAQGLLEALSSSSRIRLVQKSMNEVNAAIETYALQQDADASLVQQLRDAMDKHITKQVF